LVSQQESLKPIIAWSEGMTWNEQNKAAVENLSRFTMFFLKYVPHQPNEISFLNSVSNKTRAAPRLNNIFRRRLPLQNLYLINDLEPA